MNAPAPKPIAAHVWEAHPEQWYVEPADCTAGLLQHERFVGIVVDPCCGMGNIVNALIAAGVDAVGSDLVRRTDAAWFQGQRDFLTMRSADNIVFNPPFGRGRQAEAFIRHALAIATGKVAAFVELRFVVGERRARGLYRDHPPSRIYAVTPRPSCPPGEYILAGGEPEGGKADYVWIVWDKTAPLGDTRFLWLTRPQ